MSQGPLCPNLTQKVQKEVSQMANHNLPYVADQKIMLLSNSQKPREKHSIFLAKYISYPKNIYNVLI